MLRVTVDVFSGMPNPTWILDEEASQEVLREIADRPGIIAFRKSVPAVLGWRGMKLELMEERHALEFDLPDQFRIAAGGAEEEEGGFELAERLIEDMERHYPEEAEGADDWQQYWAAIKPDLLNALHLRPRLTARPAPRIRRITVPDPPPGVFTSGTCYIELQQFCPGSWNRPDVRPYNNCYNYATNRRTDTYAQPGRKAGQPIQRPISCASVKPAAMADGLKARGDCCQDIEQPRWLVALVVWPGVDYHWYRKHIGGFWGHKPGQTAARKTDNNEAIIIDPQTCNRGLYTEFCGYFYCCRNVTIE